jgi:hypothetical protein
MDYPIESHEVLMEKGWRSAVRGEPASANPYDKGTGHYSLWKAGHGVARVTAIDGSVTHSQQGAA